ncbi:MAG: RNase adapter RapZ [Comamonadaceae bacterium]|jgi:RNase adapter protein RapZ
MHIEPASLQLVLITGMSGSGKSVALHALEDAGFFCVDNLPPELLLPFVTLERQQNASRVAIAMDARNANSLHLLPTQFALLKEQGITVKSLFLDATTETLVRRYSETRRKHPLSQTESDPTETNMRRVLVHAIEIERELLTPLREQAHIIDTSIIRSSQLQGYVKSLITTAGEQLTLVFESFAFKRGVPTDADYVFDVRMLPNPHYEPALRHLTGRDEAVAAFLRVQADVAQMQDQIHGFLNHWLDALARDHRSYVTVAIGCTGGQHRSVYLVEQLVNLFQGRWVTLKRHRELESR